MLNNEIIEEYLKNKKSNKILKHDFLLNHVEIFVKDLIFLIEKYESLCGDTPYYLVEIDNISDFEFKFNTLFDFIRSYSKLSQCDESCEFPNELIYCNLGEFIVELSIMWGQGTSIGMSIPGDYYLSKCEDIIDLNLILSQYKASIKEF